MYIVCFCLDQLWPNLRSVRLLMPLLWLQVENFFSVVFGQPLLSFVGILYALKFPCDLVYDVNTLLLAVACIDRFLPWSLTYMLSRLPFAPPVPLCSHYFGVRVLFNIIVVSMYLSFLYCNSSLIQISRYFILKKNLGGSLMPFCFSQFRKSFDGDKLVIDCFNKLFFAYFMYST